MDGHVFITFHIRTEGSNMAKCFAGVLTFQSFSSTFLMAREHIGDSRRRLMVVGDGSQYTRIIMTWAFTIVKATWK
jgi:hypothetical protein